MKRANRLLIVDDEPAICKSLTAAAEGIGFDVAFARNRSAVLGTLREFAPTAILLDLQLPDSAGIELLRLFADQQCDAKVLVVSGDNARVHEAAIRFGTARGLNMAGSLRKPLSIPQLQDVLSDFLAGTWTVDELSTAISRGDLSVHYQPKLTRCRTTGSWIVDGAEALLRWPHPVHGNIAPSEFVPVAEDAGLMLPLTDFVLQRTLEQINFWQSRGLDLNIAVNVPPNLVSDEEFPERLCECLAHHGVENKRFVLEITESVTEDDTPLLVHVLARLRLRGVQISIDDFGCGFASLKRLLHLPFNELKIDRSFVTEIGRSDEARQVVGTMIELAHGLGMTVCAEGVETRESLAFLEARGCDRVQGFLVSKPLASADFELFLRDWSSDVMQAELPDLPPAPHRTSRVLASVAAASGRVSADV